MNSIVSIKQSRSVKYQILFLCAKWSEVANSDNVLASVAPFERKALVNLQCYFERSFSVSEFNLNVSSSELINCPKCPVLHKCYSDDYFITRIVFSVNKDALNRVKLSNSKLYGLITDCTNDRLLTMNDFTYPLNTDT